MNCPKCSHKKLKVIDSRPVKNGRERRRRYECKKCHHRFTGTERFNGTSKAEKELSKIKDLLDSINKRVERLFL